MIVLGDRYEVLATLGQGAFGAVYKVRDRQLGRVAAAKVLREAARSPEARQRFEREARLVASIRHPNVVGLLDHGQTEDGEPYLVFEFVEGSDLEAELDRGPTPERWLAWMRDLAAGLAALHERGVVHRDVKPANVLVAADGRAMVADLGLARAEEATFDGLTATGALVGTPLYMAPELFRAGAAGPEADLFALGCVAYRGLYGKDWRSPEDFAALMGGDLAPPEPGRFGRFPGTDPWLQGLLHPDPDRRLGPAERVAALLAGEAEEPGAPGEGAAALPAPAPRSVTPAGRGGARWGAMVVAGLVVVGLGVGLGVRALGGAGARPVASAPGPAEDGVAAAKEEVRKRAVELPVADRTGPDRDQAIQVYRETRVDFRTPLKFKRFLQAVQELLALGYLPREDPDDFWLNSVLLATSHFLSDIGDIGPPRIAATVLEVSRLDADQSFRETMTAIQKEVHGTALEYVVAAERAGRLGRHWREDLFHLALVKAEAGVQGAVVARSLRAGLGEVRDPRWRGFLVRGLVKLVLYPDRFGLAEAEVEAIAREVGDFVAVNASPELKPFPLSVWELARGVTAEQYLRHRRAVTRTPDPARDARLEELVDLALARAPDASTKAIVLDILLDGFEDRIGIPKGAELDVAQMEGVWALQRRLEALAKGRDEFF